MRTTPTMTSVLCLVVALVSSVEADAADPRIGMDAGGVHYFRDPAWSYVDLFDKSGLWEGAATSDPSGELDPGDTAGKWIIQNTTSLPAGRYRVSWDGSGGWNMGGFAQLISSNDASGYRIYDIDAANAPGGPGIYMSVFNNSGNLRNFSIVPVDGANQPLYPGSTFHPLYVERLGAFDTIRMMNLMAANSSQEQAWSDRATPTDTLHNTWNGTGLPVEHLVELANAAGSSPWFTMPVRADDTYVENFATYVRDHLDPGLTVYVEYGNEIWNSNFAGYAYVEQQRAISGLEFHEQWAAEAKADFAVWSDVFAGMEDRLVRVAAGQSTNRYLTPLFIDAMYEGGEAQFDAIGLGAYLNVDEGSYDATTTAADIIDDLYAALADAMDDGDIEFLGETQKAGIFRWNKQLADEHGVPLLAYEGGQHVVPGSTSVDWYDAFVAAQRDPAMGELYDALLAAYLDELGAELFAAFSYVSTIRASGAWGALEFQDQPIGEAPKYEALLNFVAVPEPTGWAMMLAAGGLWIRRRPRGRS